MSRSALVLRPEPGGRVTSDRLNAAGVATIRLPLFEIVPVAWCPPVDDYDGVLLTSANAVRQAGPGLAALSTLPVIAVGQATAAAAREAGLHVTAVGSGDATQALAIARQKGWRRVLRLGGRERTLLEGVTDVAVYFSKPLIPTSGALRLAEGTVALLHSSRAAALFRELVERDRVPLGSIRLATISGAVAEAAGGGWGRMVVAVRPDDEALVEAACTLAIDQ